MQTTRGLKGHCRSPEYNEREKNLGMEPKITTLLPTCLYIIAIHSVGCCSLPVIKRSFFKKRTPPPPFWDLFLLCPGFAPGWIWPKHLNACAVPEKKLKMWKFTDGRRRTDDGHRAMTIAHLNLWLRWAKQEAQRATYHAPENDMPPFWGIGQGGHFCILISPKNINLVEDVEILHPVKFRWIPFSGFRIEVENVSANQRPGRPSCFFRSAWKTQT